MAGLRMRKSWREKLADDKGLPVVKKIEGTMSRRWGEGTVVIPAPREVDGIMRRVPSGKLITIKEIREILAKKHGATIGCPITTGIFAGIAARAAGEAAAEGQKKLLEKEGHKVIAKGKKSVVADFEKHLTPREGWGT
ncbi:MAG TPA: hypothetical protein VM163_02250 [bacterium]|nr:hypothetical protein [bacterium]